MELPKKELFTGNSVCLHRTIQVFFGLLAQICHTFKAQPNLVESREARKKHAEHVHKDDASCLAAFEAFAGRTLEDGGAAIAVLTPYRRRLFARWAAERGIPAKHLRLVDAESLLAIIAPNNQPEPMVAREAIGMFVRTARQIGNGEVVAVGDMASLLWREGRFDNTLRLERIWERILADEHIALLCLYDCDAKDFAPDAMARIEEIHAVGR